MNVTAILAAGGLGTRLGGARPKQLLAVGGRTLLERSLDALLASEVVGRVVVVLPATAIAEASPSLAGDTRVVIVEGGARRQDSVARGFEAVEPSTEIVVVHDAARPFVPPPLVARVVQAAAARGAAIAAIPSRDTVKRARAHPPGESPSVGETLPRDEIWLAQTPQAFRYAVLRDAVALGRAGTEATDEATLAELAGHAVTLVEGDVRNVKITTEADLRMAQAIAAGRHAAQRGGPGAEAPPACTVEGPVSSRAESAPAFARTGVGYDLHRFVRGRALVLGGVRIPHDVGLAGHSDADAIAHAVTDAVLGAAGLGDIGGLFPDTDPRWQDADSMQMLRDAVRLLHEAGYVVGNVDVVVVAERPKIGPHREAIRASVAAALGVAPNAVGVKGKTNEGVDALGRGEALAVHAVASVHPAAR